MNGYLDALAKHKIKSEKNLIITCRAADLNSHEEIRKLLKRKNRPDGIFASVEKLAIDAYEICNELSLSIPEDIKILCFSNLKTAPLLNPSMTTVTQPAFEIGREAASILFKLVEKKGHHFLQEKTVIKSSLIQRNSTKGPVSKK